jgi:hypothetical protein
MNILSDQFSVRIWSAMFVLTVVMVMYSCASSGILTGGPKDVTPPVLDSVRSSPFYQTNYFPRELNFYFNEFIEVRDPIKQVLISPPTTYIPKITHRGKKLSFRFDDKEILRPDATYSINFGEAVMDFTEGNKVDNFIYVFATGDVIDSLSFDGTVTDAITGKPDEGIFVFLYDNLSDSAIAKEKPFYFVKTDKAGAFRFSNIRSDSFRLFALKDENVNYLYDLANEKIAFYDDVITLTDTAVYKINLKSSVADFPPALRSSITSEYGKTALVYSTKPDTITWIASPMPERIFTQIKGDSLLFYYDTQLDSFNIETPFDIVKVRPKGRSQWISKSGLKIITTNVSRVMKVSDSIRLDFNYPVSGLNTDLISITDSIGIPDNIDIRLTDNRLSMIINAGWRPSNTYFIRLDSGAVDDFYGHGLDSIEFVAGFSSPEQLGGINLEVKGLDSTLVYLLLVRRADKQIFSTEMRFAADYKTELKALQLEKYTIEIIEDSNGNGKWDPGNYWKRRQPEKILITETERLRANWDADVIINWTSDNTPAEPEAEKKSLDGKG